MGFYKGGSSTPKDKLTQQKGNSPAPARPPPSASSSKSQSSVPSTLRPAVKVTPSTPPPPLVTVQRTSGTVERTHATAKKSHRFNPSGRPDPKPGNPSSLGQNLSLPPSMPNRPSVTSTPPLPQPPAPKPGSIWNQFSRPPVPPILSALPCHLGGSPRALPPVHLQQTAPSMMQIRQPPSCTSSSFPPGGRGQVAAAPTSGQQQLSPPIGSSYSLFPSSSRGREVEPAPQPAPVVVGTAATDLGPLGFSLQRVVRVRDPSPGTASRLPSFSYDWVCCFCHRNNNESRHPLQCTNPACLHVRVTDNRPGKKWDRPMTDNLIYRLHEPKVPGAEVCPDCSYVTYQWLDGRRVPEPVQNPLGMPPPPRR